jgi:hypothetical protein
MSGKTTNNVTDGGCAQVCAMKAPRHERETMREGEEI